MIGALLSLRLFFGLADAEPPRQPICPECLPVKSVQAPAPFTCKLVQCGRAHGDLRGERQRTQRGRRK